MCKSTDCLQETQTQDPVSHPQCPCAHLISSSGDVIFVVALETYDNHVNEKEVRVSYFNHQHPGIILIWSFWSKSGYLCVTGDVDSSHSYTGLHWQS